MINALEIAKMFHDTTKKLDPKLGFESWAGDREFDPTTKDSKIFIAVCQQVGDYIQQLSFQAGFQAGLREKNL